MPTTEDAKLGEFFWASCSRPCATDSAAIWRNPQNDERTMNLPSLRRPRLLRGYWRLVFKKIFPALYAMERRGHLKVPIVGVARSDWTIEKFRARALASVKKQDGFDKTIFARFRQRLHYISGDYNATDTYTSLRKEIGKAAHPLHFLAIPPSVFAE